MADEVSRRNNPACQSIKYLKCVSRPLSLKLVDKHSTIVPCRKQVLKKKKKLQYLAVNMNTKKTPASKSSDLLRVDCHNPEPVILSSKGLNK
jgi:hypothetical protein